MSIHTHSEGSELAPKSVEKVFRKKTIEEIFGPQPTLLSLDVTRIENMLTQFGDDPEVNKHLCRICDLREQAMAALEPREQLKAEVDTARIAGKILPAWLMADAANMAEYRRGTVELVSDGLSNSELLAA